MKRIQRAVFIYFFVFCSAFYFLLFKGYPFFHDESIMFQTTRNMIEHGRFDTIPHPLITKKGIDGRSYSNYGIGPSIVQAPFYLAGRIAAPLLPLKEHDVLQIAVSLSAPVIMLLIIYVFINFSMNLGYSPHIAFLSSLTIATASMFLPYSKLLFRDPLQTLLLTASVYLIYKGTLREHRQRHFFITAGVLYGFALTVKAALIIFFPLLAGYIVWKNRRRRIQEQVSSILLFCAGPAAGGAASLYYNYIRFGNALDFGYAQRNLFFGFNTPLVEGLYGLLVSSGKGILIYNPLLLPVLLALPAFYRKHRRETLLFLGLASVSLLFHAKYWTWGGSWCWGPRYLLPVLPFLLLPLNEVLQQLSSSSRIKKAAVALIILISFGIQILGTLVHFANYLQFVADEVHLFPLWIEGDTNLRSDLFYVDFVPVFSPVVGHWWIMKGVIKGGISGNEEETVAYMKRNCPWRNLNPDWAPDRPDRSIRLGFDLWFMTWPKRFKTGIWLFPSVAFLLAGAAVFSIMQFARKNRLLGRISL